MPRQFKRR
jgi:IS5 family transposase